MARAKPPATVAPKLELSAREIEWAIKRIDDRISELENFDIKIVIRSTPELAALSTSIAATLERAFGENTSAYQRYAAATKLQYVAMTIAMDGYSRQVDYQGPTKANITRSIALMRAAKGALTEDLAYLQEATEPESLASTDTSALSRRVFVVHGHDDAALQGLARFLEKLGLEAIILKEQPDQGRTIIEKFEASAADVGFAVVLLTPDDLGGSAKSDTPDARARQNVIFELGFFAGKLGRGRVCLLRKGHVEIPSDLYGVIYTDMDSGEGWQTKLVRELKAAKLEFDANKLWQ
ncbi:putative nucleotide-binding protein containing TIR -like domain-containing protein [Pseudomonas sp. GM79]|jgi:predicted nucleotide-binding protein|uniref:TIR domain-containing protein n=1 Tax=unclassified Pseudomonas TaxID=196821 RepID=UPI00026F5908|nr:MULTISPECIES: nucleotide-binding protein [unclassified Pseudomonas]EJN23800.1 putative nucleotide-binding protein containing TIR -like domain-containing protein [Pseudomonas sp. GM79]